MIAENRPRGAAQPRNEPALTAHAPMKAARPPPLAPVAAPAQAEGGAGAASTLRQHTARVLLAAGVLVAVLAVASGTAFGLGLDHAAKALLAYGLGASLVWRGLATHPHARFGPANGVTLLRLASVALLAALVGEPLPVPDCMGISLQVDGQPWGVLTLDALQTGTFGTAARAADAGGAADQ